MCSTCCVTVHECPVNTVYLIFIFVYSIFRCVSIRLLKCGLVRQNTTLYLLCFIISSFAATWFGPFRPSSGYLGDGVLILFTYYLYLHYATTTISVERSLITFYVYFSCVGFSCFRGRLLFFFRLRSSILYLMFGQPTFLALPSHFLWLL
jgi:hypothetical protein